MLGLRVAHPPPIFFHQGIMFSIDACSSSPCVSFATTFRGGHGIGTVRGRHGGFARRGLCGPGLAHFRPRKAGGPRPDQRRNGLVAVRMITNFVSDAQLTNCRGVWLVSWPNGSVDKDTNRGTKLCLSKSR